MDFFGEQDRAKSKTSQLWFLFFCAVLTIVTSLTIVIVVSVSFYAPHEFLNVPNKAKNSQDIWALLQNIGQYGKWDSILMIPLVLTGLILGASIFKYAVIASQGGPYIARLLGGIKLEEAVSHEEKVLLNVVEEMALASGIPVPEIYILRSQSEINAFAAGLEVEKAVIGVSQGAIEQLSRDELQGVIAHEFSHIFHGDMKINAKLMGVLFGILFIYEIGSSFFQYAPYRTRRSSKGNGGGYIFIIMLAFMLIGLIGYFFGSLIKAAISRQREFLADAAAVQYTRNPAGISMALAKIGQFGSIIKEKKTAQITHMLFANGMNPFLQIFATHPPLSARINKLGVIKVPNGAAKGHYASLLSQPMVQNLVSSPVRSQSDKKLSINLGEPPIQNQDAKLGSPLHQSSASELLEHIGSVSSRSLSNAKEFMARLPSRLKESVHNRQEVSLFLYSLGVSFDEACKNLQLKYIAQNLQTHEVEKVIEFHKDICSLGQSALIPLIDLAMPSLRNLGDKEKKKAVTFFIKIAESKQKIELLDYLLIKILETNLDDSYLPRPNAHKAAILSDAKACIISALAEHGTKNKNDHFRSYLSGVKYLNLGARYYQQVYPWNLVKFDSSIRSLNRLNHKQKRYFIEVCSKVAKDDGVIDEQELIILRGICDCLGCPSPFF